MNNKKEPLEKVEDVTTDKPNLPIVERIEIRLLHPNGVRELKILNGTEAQKWNVFMRQVCETANKHGDIPDFAKLKWQDINL